MKIFEISFKNGKRITIAEDIARKVMDWPNNEKIHILFPNKEFSESILIDKADITYMGVVKSFNDNDKSK